MENRLAPHAHPAAHKLPSKKWRDLILRVWHVDPLRCPVCQSPMRAIAVIDDPLVAEKILCHLGALHDPPARLPPSGCYTYEPWTTWRPPRTTRMR